MTKQPVSGSSDKIHPDGAKCIGDCDPSEQIEVIVMLRRKDEAGFRQMMSRIDAGEAPGQAVSREEFDRRFTASDEDIDKVKAFAKQYGLSVERAETETRSVVLKGTIEQFQKAFDVKLERFQHHNIGEYRGRTGPVNVPDEMHDAVTAVLGLDSKPQARPHFRFRPPFKPLRGRRPRRSRRSISRSSMTFPMATAPASASRSSNWAAATATAISPRISPSSA